MLGETLSAVPPVSEHDHPVFVGPRFTLESVIGLQGASGKQSNTPAVPIWDPTMLLKRKSLNTGVPVAFVGGIL